MSVTSIRVDLEPNVITSIKEEDGIVNALKKSSPAPTVAVTQIGEWDLRPRLLFWEEMPSSS